MTLSGLSDPNICGILGLYGVLWQCCGQDGIMSTCQCRQAGCTWASMTLVQVLPDYLKEEITFTAMHKQKLVGRIMEALGTLSIRQARGGQ